MIPPFFTRPLRLRPRILNRHALPYAKLLHRIPVQAPFIGASRHPIVAQGSESLASRTHAEVLPLELQFLCLPLLCVEKLPCTVDRPVSQVSQAREAERSWGFGVVEEVTNEGYR